MSYYTIITREQPTDPWAPQFGDHDREVVDQEMIDTYRYLPKAQRKIIRTKTAHQSVINAAIAQLNAQV